MGGA
jgi:hypothetical protein